MNHAKFVDGIRQTGFPLENKTVETLIDAKWSIISNKYYMDSDKSLPREIDILAYRVGDVNGIEVVTALIISCKKSEKFVWSFLTRKAALNNPNVVSNPVHFLTDYSPLAYYLDKDDWRNSYCEKVARLGVAEVLKTPDYQVFALQEMVKGVGGDAKQEGKPNSDSAMFESIISLMKAQHHEESLRKSIKRPKPRIYQFNLISLADTDFLRLHFERGNIIPYDVDWMHYVATYIFDRRDTFSRVLFVRSSAFEEMLKDYDRLHAANKRIAADRIEEFFDGILTDRSSRRGNVLLEQFRSELKSEIFWYLLDWDEQVNFEHLRLRWDEDGQKVIIRISAPAEAIQYMNSDAYVIQDTVKVFREIYKYDGKFEFQSQ